jgi:hypothetical protein
MQCFLAETHELEHRSKVDSIEGNQIHASFNQKIKESKFPADFDQSKTKSSAHSELR